MRVLILPDAAFVQRERALLERLEIGLADEGVRVIHAIPASWAGSDVSGVYSVPLIYPDHGVPFSLPLRAAAVLQSIADAAPCEPGQAVIDIVHCFGLASWPMGLALAAATGAAVQLEVWDSSTVPAAVQAHERVMRSTAAVRTRLVAAGADEPLSALLRRSLPESAVRLTPWGVHVPDEVPARSGDGASLSAVLLASGRQPEAIRAALAGLGAAAASVSETLVFVDAHLARTVPVWRWAQSCGLGDRLSVIADMELQRSLVLHADVLLMPETAGEHRTLALDAMASGVRVLAGDDPLVSWLHDGRTALLVRPLLGAAAPAAWKEAILGMVGTSPRAVALAASARAFVAEHRSASAHVLQVLRAYDSILAPAGPPAPAAS